MSIENPNPAVATEVPAAQPAVPAVAPAAPAPNLSAPPSLPAEDGVKIPRSMFEDWQRQINDHNQKLAAEAEKARIAEEKALKHSIAEGDTRKALEMLNGRIDQDAARLKREGEAALKAEQDRAAAEIRRRDDENARLKNERDSIEARSRKWAIDSQVGQALAKYNLTETGASDAMELLKGKFIVEPSGDSYAVRATTGQTVAEYVDAFVKARPGIQKAAVTHGGTIGGFTSPSVQPENPPSPPPVQPKNMGEAIILQMQQIQKAQGDSRANMSLPMGLRATR